MTGKELRELRTKHNLTQRQLAELTNRTPGSISQYEMEILPISENLEKELLRAIDEADGNVIDYDGIPARIRELRGSLSQRQFAEILGCSNSHIAMVETKKEKPSKDWLRTVAAKLNVNFGWLAYGVEGDDAEGELKEIEAWYRSHPEERKKIIEMIRRQ